MIKKVSIYTFMLLCCLFCATLAGAKDQKPVRISLSKALKEKMVQLDAVSTQDTYNKKGVRITVMNNTSENMLLDIDAAIILQPEDSQYQNLVLEGQELLAVNGGKTRMLELQTYCGESKDRAPVFNHAYHFAGLGDSTMIKVLQFIKMNHVQNTMAQHAIWVLTDKHNLSDVYDYSDPVLSRKLVALMGNLLGVEAPEYFTVKELNEMQGEFVRQDKTLKLVANLKWVLSAPEKLSLNIYNDKGERIASYFDHKDFVKGHYDLNASFETIDYPAGAYTIRLQTEQQAVIKEIRVNLE